jgi:hypothetical protein
MTEKKKKKKSSGNKQNKESRQVSRIVLLEELAEKAQKLYKLAESGETAAKQLGEVLLDVKSHHPFGGLKVWIQANIGKDESTRNRCNYAISLASGSREKRKAAAATKAAQLPEVLEIKAAVIALTAAAKKGEPGEVLKQGAIISTAVDSLVKKAEAVYADSISKKGSYPKAAEAAACKS